jgi:phage gp29-like protein
MKKIHTYPPLSAPNLNRNPNPRAEIKSRSRMKPGKEPLAPLKNTPPDLLGPPAPSSLAHGLNLGTVVNIQNHWREYYDPLRALNIPRAVALYDFSRRGLNAELQNVYREMEGLYPTLIGLIERRTSPLLEMEWTCQPVTPEKLPRGATVSQSEDQAACLREAYDRIDNLYDAIEWLELGAFRGWSHLEKIYANPGTEDLTIEHLEPVEQWHWTRKSMYAEWEYIAAATQTNVGVPINYDQFVIHEVRRPLDRIALILWIRANLCEKDWDAFIELYGIPRWVIIMPPNVPKEKEAEYKSAAISIANGGNGALPNGSEAKSSEARSEGRIFRPRLDWLQEQLVLAGTGGLLSMLSMPTGIGDGASDAHADAFAKIGVKEARKISEVFNRQFDAPILAAKFPKQPCLASFTLAAKKETDVAEFVASILSLSQSGYQVDPKEVSEVTGYTVTLKAVPPTKPDPENEELPSPPNEDVIKNRAAVEVSADLISATAGQFAGAVQSDFKALADRLYGILELDDPALELAAARKLMTELNDPKSALIRNAMRFPDSARVLTGAIVAGYFNGLATNEAGRLIKNRATKILNGSPDQARDNLGKWVDENGGGLSETDNIKRGNKAMDRSIRQKADVQKAMYRKEVGQIDFQYGTPGKTDDDFKGGFGVSHILAKHGEADARAMPVVLARGKITMHPEGDDKRLVEHGDYTAALARKNSRSAFVLTGFKRKVK